MPERLQAAVVGAGPAGLAVSACLRDASIPHALLEREASVAASWRRHYDRLHLHTDRRRSSLPGAPFPPGTPRYPSRDQVIAYLERYAAERAAPPRLGEEVREARPAPDGWALETSRGRFHARHLVVATGMNGEPVEPTWPGLEAFPGEVLHSARYRNGAPWRGRDVLVVGLGNSGGEIAIDLHEHGARPALSVRGPVCVIPREILGLPVLAIAVPLSRLPPRLADLLSRPLVRATLGDPARAGLPRADTGPMEQVARRRRIPLIDVGTLALLRAGAVRLFPALAGFDGAEARFADGRAARFDAVVLATGYRPCLAFLRGAPAPGDPRARAQRLHYCGFDVVATGMLRQIAIEARAIARAVASAP
jgi:cation diffusion facilitator CzcD-associated flavoprotein CzcO